MIVEPSPPKFTLSPPHYMNVSAGSTVTLTCKATGIPRPGVSWYKDGQPVAREDITRVNGISLLPLKNVQPYDQGKYWCEAENAEGRNRSSSTHLKSKKFCNQRFFIFPSDYLVLSPNCGFKMQTCNLSHQ